MKSNNLYIRNGQMEACLNIVLFTSEGQRIAYAPALEIMSYGNDDKSAMKSFNAVFRETVRYMAERKTHDSELEKL